MALIHCDFFSHVLGVGTSMHVILPQRPAVGDTPAPRPPIPVLYLLHGLSDDHTAWVRQTAIERHVAPYNLAVVMPRVERSYYTDMASGPAYWTFLSEELPRLAADFFPLSTRREDTFAAGLSMGGYGAFKLAFRQPGRFAAAASLSGGLDPASSPRLQDEPARRQEFTRIFGDLAHLRGSPDDLFRLAADCAVADGPRPRLYQCCGASDFLIEPNHRFRDHLRELGFDLTYDESPGVHEWGYWDAAIRRVLRWLPLTSTT